MTAPDPRLDEIQARLSKTINPGEWEARQDYIDGGVPDNSMTIVTRDNRIYIGTIALHYDGNNAEFIANAPADVRYLLAELRKAREALAAIDVVPPISHGIDADARFANGYNEALRRVRAAVAAAKGDERG